MKKILLLLISIATLSGCSNDDTGNASELKIRLSNASAFDFQNIAVDTSTGITIFEDIGAQEKTAYKTFQTAYRYAFVQLEINGEIYILQPTDYVGETPLDNGKYTYQIDANDTQEQYGRLSLTLIVD